MPSQVESINFFSPVYASANEREHSEEKLAWLGRIVEPYFDLWQDSYRVVSDCRHGSSVTVELSSPLKSWEETAMRVVVTSAKLLSYLTIVLPLAMLFAKMVYRTENHFVLLSNKEREVELKNFLRGIRKNALLFDQTVDVIDFEKIESLKVSCYIIEELEKWKQVLSRYPEQCPLFEEKVELIESTILKLRDTVRYGDAVKTIVFNQGLLKKFRKDDLNDYNKHVDQFFTKFQEELGVKKSENGNWKITLDFVGSVSKKSEPKIVYPFRGIPNIGNSCYMNSLLQPLLANPVFKKRFKEGDIDEYQAIKKATCRTVPENLVNPLFDDWKACSLKVLRARLKDLESLEEGFKNPDEGLLFSIQQDFLVESPSILQSNDWDDRRKVWRELKMHLCDYVRVRNVVEKLSNFIKIYENPHRTLENPARDLRQALFEAGVIQELKQQSDASEVLIYLIDILGASMPLKQHWTTELKDGPFTRDRIDPVSVIPIELNATEETSFQEIIDQYFSSKSSGSEEEAWNLEGTTGPIVDENGEQIKVHHWEEECGISGEPPKYIQIQLKRFEKDASGNSKKITTPVTFLSLEVDMTEKFEKLNPGEKALYKIKAVTIHRGSMNGGHYWSLLEEDGKWYKCDDSSVSLVSDPQKEISNGYIYFLEKV